jgi:hypothetical protein
MIWRCNNIQSNCEKNDVISSNHTTENLHTTLLLSYNCKLGGINYQSLAFTTTPGNESLGKSQEY